MTNTISGAFPLLTFLSKLLFVSLPSPVLRDAADAHKRNNDYVAICIPYSKTHNGPLQTVASMRKHIIVPLFYILPLPHLIDP